LKIWQKQEQQQISTFPDESALPKSFLGVSQHERELRKAIRLHISHNTGHNKMEYFLILDAQSHSSPHSDDVKPSQEKKSGARRLFPQNPTHC